MDGSSISLVIAGSGGAGALTAGNLLLAAAARVGWFAYLTRSVGPQIRGGEAAAMIRLGSAPVAAHDDAFHVLLAIDWDNVERFAAEMPLTATSLVIGDSAGGAIPDVLLASGAQSVTLPMRELARAIPGGRANMVALGAIAALVGLPAEVCAGVLARELGGKGAAALTASEAAMRAGMAAVAALAEPRVAAGSRVGGDFRGVGESQVVGESLSVAEGAPQPALPQLPRLPLCPEVEGLRWSISGNECTGLGALRGGVRFVAAYPITPATEVLEWLAPALPRVGGTLVQAEDELASINQIIGASFGGVPSMTATSGPGLSLMIESLGLAVAAEVPVVVVNVMRGGPSTGIPAKSEQSDLNIACYGLHGDAPHLVLAPNSVADCLLTTQWAVHLAEALQTAAIVLTDQAMGQARAVITRPAELAFIGQREVPARLGAGYGRYAVTASGVSPMAVPGMAGGEYTADGLEHNEIGTPSSQAADHAAQLDKRQRKLSGFRYGDLWAEVDGEDEVDGERRAAVAVLTWGSSTGPAREAVQRLRAQGIAVRLVAPRLLAPALPQQMAAALGGVERVLVVEQSHGGQFYHYLRAHYDLPGEVHSLRQPGPLPIRPATIVREVIEWR